ncbi:HalOD1 output domain-containing protein [Haladaptatus sp. CMAA 1911]|uniref:HalOD1 output domain-containing protein n=1 Tax=unclassified Haladaptatus TaxID=2622732 RepID=UPI0037544FA5
MPSKASATEATWFEDNRPGPSVPPQYVLQRTRSVDADESLTVSLVEALVDTLEPPERQASLSLYEYVNPEALEDLIEASEEKESGIEVRFTIDDHLVTVRSNGTILIHERIQWD